MLAELVSLDGFWLGLAWVLGEALIFFRLLTVAAFGAFDFLKLLGVAGFGAFYFYNQWVLQGSGMVVAGLGMSVAGFGIK